jgi:hypothetical protein
MKLKMSNKLLTRWRTHEADVILYAGLVHPVSSAFWKPIPVPWNSLHILGISTLLSSCSHHEIKLGGSITSL